MGMSEVFYFKQENLILVCKFGLHIDEQNFVQLLAMSVILVSFLAYSFSENDGDM
jgi:hypothetical protein